MTKKTIKRALPILLGSLIVSLAASIIPNDFMVEASKGNKNNKDAVVREVLTKDKKDKYINLEDAVDIAVRKVNKKRSELTDYEISLTYDDPHYMIEITTTNNDKVYKVYKIKVDGITGKILNVDVEQIKEKDYKDNINNGTFISKSEAKTIALKKVNNSTANIVKFVAELKREVPHYLASVITSTHQYIMKINAKTGDVYDLEIFAKDSRDNLYYFDNNKQKGNAVKVYEYYRSRHYKDTTVDGKYISKEDAIKRAIAEIGKEATLDKIELDKDDNTPKYEVKMYDKDYKYKVELHAVTGQILKYKKEIITEKDKEKNPPVVGVKYITKEEAIKKALERIGRDAKLDEIEFKKNNNPPKYEIEMYNSDYEYEIEVHAITGAILKFEREDD